MPNRSNHKLFWVGHQYSKGQVDQVQQRGDKTCKRHEVGCWWIPVWGPVFPEQCFISCSIVAHSSGYPQIFVLLDSSGTPYYPWFDIPCRTNLLSLRSMPWAYIAYWKAIVEMLCSQLKLKRPGYHQTHCQPWLGMQECSAYTTYASRLLCGHPGNFCHAKSYKM